VNYAGRWFYSIAFENVAGTFQLLRGVKMLEIIVLVSIAGLFAVCLFSPKSCSLAFFGKSDKAGSHSAPLAKEPASEDSTLRNPFLGQLQADIEAALFPRPTDSVLQRHYDAMVAIEVRNRLAAMTS
jgi:hypothetical protein